MNKALVSDEKKLTVLLLCWLVGFFGAHRFYTGKHLSGGLQLMGVVLGVVAAIFKFKDLTAPLLIIYVGWWIIDVLLIIMGKFPDKEGKPIVDWV
jgi:TM2 domain-containing membrane protein YozV